MVHCHWIAFAKHAQLVFLWVRGGGASRSNKPSGCLFSWVYFTHNLAFKAVFFGPDFKNWSLSLLKDLLSSTFVHRLKFGNSEALWVIVHPKVYFHRVDKLLCNGGVLHHQLVIGLHRWHLVIDHVDELNLGFLSIVNFHLCLSHWIELHVLVIIFLCLDSLLKFTRYWVTPLIRIHIVYITLHTWHVECVRIMNCDGAARI